MGGDPRRPSTKSNQGESLLRLLTLVPIASLPRHPPRTASRNLTNFTHVEDLVSRRPRSGARRASFPEIAPNWGSWTTAPGMERHQDWAEKEDGRHAVGGEREASATEEAPCSSII